VRMLKARFAQNFNGWRNMNKWRVLEMPKMWCTWNILQKRPTKAKSG
jgi:hypothetical protein